MSTSRITTTVAYYGPVTVSVVVSAVPITTNYDIPPIIITLVLGQLCQRP